jgi:hypothetical protein
MTLSEQDYFIMSRTIKGIQERVEEIRSWDIEDKALEEVAGMLQGLKEVVVELNH